MILVWAIIWIQLFPVSCSRIFFLSFFFFFFLFSFFPTRKKVQMTWKKGFKTVYVKLIEYDSFLVGRYFCILLGLVPFYLCHNNYIVKQLQPYKVENCSKTWKIMVLNYINIPVFSVRVSGGFRCVFRPKQKCKGRTFCGLLNNFEWSILIMMCRTKYNKAFKLHTCCFSLHFHFWCFLKFLLYKVVSVFSCMKYEVL